MGHFFAPVDTASLGDPQSLNLYGYVGNDPVNRIDPSGLFWGKLFKRLFQRVVNAFISAVIIAVYTFMTTGNPHAALAAGIGEFVKGLIAHPTISLGRTTPGFNPNASPVFGTGVSSVNRSLIIYNLLGNGQVPLTGEYLKVYTRLRRNALKGVRSKKCREFLKKLEAETNDYRYQASYLENAILDTRAFDGAKSTIGLLAAGATNVTNSTETVQQHLRNGSTIAVTGAFNFATRHDSYFNVSSPYFSSAVIVHEALHGTLYGKTTTDVDIATAIAAVDPPTSEAEWDLFSNNSAFITQRLKKNGCGK